jgi:pilus assembly protein CpaB
MRAKAILSVLFLISLAVAVIVVLRALPQLAPAGAQEAARDDILVATTPLATGTLLRPQDVVWEKAKGDTVPGQIVRPDVSAREAKPELDDETRATVYGAALRKQLAAGDPIRRGDIAKPGDRDFLEIVLSPGTRAIAIPVHMAADTGPNTRFLGPFPGDHVDIVLTQKFKQDLPLTRSSVGEAVVENIRVLAIAPPDPKGPRNPAAASTGEVTIPLVLEVTPEQAEKITVATELGKLNLTLRSGSGSDGVATSVTPGPAGATAIKAIWAGDVSPALGGAIPQKPVPVERLPVEVIHGSKTERVSAPWHSDKGGSDRDAGAGSKNDAALGANDGHN